LDASPDGSRGGENLRILLRRFVATEVVATSFGEDILEGRELCKMRTQVLEQSVVASALRGSCWRWRANGLGNLLVVCAGQIAKSLDREAR
jgi:hypothetical protein